MNIEHFNLNFSLDELNKILQSLGKEPYVEVFQLIDKIQQQAQQQLRAQGNGQLSEKEQLINSE